MEKVIDLKKRSPDELEEKALLSWEIEEKTARKKNWQIGLIVFLITCFTFVLWQKNYFGLILILVIAFLVFFSPTKKRTYFAVLQRGARRGTEIFPWHNLKDFWVFETPPEIYFTSKKTPLSYHIIFPLPKDYIEKARKIISNFIPEKEMEKNILDLLSERLGL